MTLVPLLLICISSIAPMEVGAARIISYKSQNQVQVGSSNDAEFAALLDINNTMDVDATMAGCSSICKTREDCYTFKYTCAECAFCKCEDFCKTKEDCTAYKYSCKGCMMCNKAADHTVTEAGKKKDTEQLMGELKNLVGLGKVKSLMNDLLAQVQFNMERKNLGLPDIGKQSLHMAFLGNPGTGKTVVARIVGEILVNMGAIKQKKEKTVIVKEVSRADLVGQYTGTTAIKVKEAVKDALGGVLFVDEAYALVQGSRDPFGKEAVDALIKEMEDHRDELIVILAGYNKEMEEFINSNPGFKSRIAFMFPFADYTCSELVKIGEIKLKSNGVDISLKHQHKCFSEGGGDLSDACKWFQSTIQLRTGCVEDTSGNHEQEENRANGNGRTVRNILEASYRAMAARVMSTYQPKVLDAYDKKNKPKVTGTGKNSKPQPDLKCTGTFATKRKGGPYTTLEELGDADVRCAFRLLEAPDISTSFAEHLTERLISNCVERDEPMHVNVSQIVSGMKPEATDWMKLHGALVKKKSCKEAQAFLKQSAWKQKHSGVDRSLLEEFEGSLLEANTSMCKYEYCKSKANCKNWRCRSCSMCITAKPYNPSQGNYHKLYGPSYSGSYSYSYKPSYSSHYTHQSGYKPYSQYGTDNTAVGQSGNFRCKICHWAKAEFASKTKQDLTYGVKADKECSKFLSKYGLDASLTFDCQKTLGRVVLYMGFKGTNLECDLGSDSKLSFGRGVTKCPADNSGALAGNLGGALSGALGDWQPVVRPGSKVEDEMKNLNEMIGLKTVKAGMSSLRDTVEFDMWRKRFYGADWSLLGQSFHMQFLGNPGTGKTAVARIVGRILVELEVIKTSECKKNEKKKKKTGDADDELVFVEVSRADLVAGYVGQTAPKVQEAVKSACGGVLFVDEAYSLVQDEKDAFGREAVDTLIKEMEDQRDRVIVIFAGYNKEMESFFKSNPGFQSRVPFRFDFPDYSCEDLGDIAELMLKPQSISMEAEARSWFDKVAKAKTGCCTTAQIDSHMCAGSTRDNGNGRTVRNIMDSALRSMSVRVVGKENEPGYTPLADESTALIKTLTATDVASVAGHILGEVLRATCKESKDPVPDLEALATGPRILAITDYESALQNASETCTATTEMLEGLRPPKHSAVTSAMDIEIKDPDTKKVFDDLDEYVGLTSVKRAMRELYCTVQINKMRAMVGLKPLKSQTFHMRFVGNPGTGKTVVARVVGRLLLALGAIEPPKKDSKQPVEEAWPDEELDNQVFQEVSRSELVAQYSGQTANKTIAVVKESLGGILFIDEAYSLVQNGRDTFGHEAVDALIKEMEDKRKQLIVILAGYEKEMDKFFDSNPGFKSRVPFSFNFDDYTCAELQDIGKLQIKGKGLSLADGAQDAFDQSLRFTTGCCDKVEDCEESRDKGNGRAVRNTIESAVRSMAKRLMALKRKASREQYTLLEASDFSDVTEEFIERWFDAPCAPGGELSRLMKSVEQWNGGLERVPKTSKGRQDLISRLDRLTSQVALFKTMSGLKAESAALGNRCFDSIQSLVQVLEKYLREACGRNGSIDQIKKKMKESDSAVNMQGYAQILTSAIRDQEFLRRMIGITDGKEVFSAIVPDTVEQVDRLCDGKAETIAKMTFNVPFPYDMLDAFSQSDLDA